MHVTVILCCRKKQEFKRKEKNAKNHQFISFSIFLWKRNQSKNFYMQVLYEWYIYLFINLLLYYIITPQCVKQKYKEVKNTTYNSKPNHLISWKLFKLCTF